MSISRVLIVSHVVCLPHFLKPQNIKNNEYLIILLNFWKMFIKYISLKNFSFNSRVFFVCIFFSDFISKHLFR